MKQVTRKYRYVAYVFYKDGKLVSELSVLNERLIPAIDKEIAREVSAGLQNKDIWDGKFFKCFSVSNEKWRILNNKKHHKADRVVRVIREGEVSGYVYK